MTFLRWLLQCGFLIIFGILGIFTNLALIIFIWKKPMKIRFDQLTLGCAVGCAMLAFSYCIEFGRFHHFYDDASETTALHCLLWSFHPVTYSLADITVSMMNLFMAVDFAFAITNFARSFSKIRLINKIMISFYISSFVLDIALCFIVFALLPDKSVPISCAYSKTLPLLYQLYHFIFCSILGIITIIIFAASLWIIKKKKSHCTTIRLVQIKRQQRISKRILTNVLFTLLIENVPFTVSVFALCNKTVHWTSSWWLLQVFPVPIYPIYQLSKEDRIRKCMKNVSFSCKKKKKMHVQPECILLNNNVKPTCISHFS
ncbi:hypothetical protein T4A_7302 [Trichinella pseudospiralis]|uniref:G-protein coupled receptors family 1 profile domain-containing protein n=1 Tax=Trichinella pseudospiralis TaxID=6337 RepID=A0A0V1JW53_TRIPS|nr:hypothetical protein T4E_10924 [Trichinella pseudospiralis]KRY73101.1 hypothetical protein T4A_7302 [Trichinella pseudospiralis]KRY86805.1 hypothetical protein T4D_15095 [Trichinella pseudospiralis]KRZ39216.1 hypothetical protein T4C_2341 [Trichinella pseudospiralis]